MLRLHGMQLTCNHWVLPVARGAVQPQSCVELHSCKRKRATVRLLPCSRRFLRLALRVSRRHAWRETTSCLQPHPTAGNSCKSVPNSTQPFGAVQLMQLRKHYRSSTILFSAVQLHVQLKMGFFRKNENSRQPQTTDCLESSGVVNRLHGSATD